MGGHAPCAPRGSGKTDGTVVDIVIGEKDGDPVFSIDDLLPHLSRKVQDEKSLSTGIEGEKLTVLFGSLPLVGEAKEGIKRAILKILKDIYGIVEEDFISAELEVVPAFKARDVGIDRSLIGAYGQDDRSSAYALLRAVADISEPDRACLAIFVDKEEIGSEGNTGMKSKVLQVFLYNVLEGMGMKADAAMVGKMLFSSRALSADVNAALNPDVPGRPRETERMLPWPRRMHLKVYRPWRQGRRERRKCRICGRHKKGIFP